VQDRPAGHRRAEPGELGQGVRGAVPRHSSLKREYMNDSATFLSTMTEGAASSPLNKLNGPMTSCDECLESSVQPKEENGGRLRCYSRPIELASVGSLLRFDMLVCYG
jgi:hypothetical protein